MININNVGWISDILKIVTQYEIFVKYSLALTIK